MTRFMTLDFADGDLEQTVRKIAVAARSPYGYVVTPNVDHVVKLLDGTVPREIYEQAALRLCDSRILKLLAKLRGKSLSLCLGSDLTGRLLRSTDLGDTVIAVFGPDKAAFDDLAARYPKQRLVYLPAPMMAPGSEEWGQAVNEVAGADWDILLACVSFPKQELFAKALSDAGRKTGVALCVGASVDFLTGRQQRAPKLMRHMSLEWLHRLLSQPRRMFRRYVIEGPAILGWFVRTEVLKG
ncbi:MAG: glycosyltransferase [Brevundimonas sp.]|nr:MAG: glycosyltransferase [Brevundimonas sp.]